MYTIAVFEAPQPLNTTLGDIHAAVAQHTFQITVY
jgi:hypothetical protein